MRVATYYSNSDIRLEELPKPKISKGEVLVKIFASGICGSDCLEWYRLGRTPLVLGHELSGEICEIGNGVKNFKIGDRVVVAHHVPCGSCHYCLSGHETVCETLRKTNIDPGGFAEYARIPSINVEKGVFLMPDSMTFEEGTFVEPLSCVLRGQRIAGFKKNQSVLVIGSGIAGLLHIILARFRGASKIFAVDINKFRLNIAKKSGADYIFEASNFNPSDISKLNDSRLADLVVLCTGAKSAINQAFKSVERGGTILFFAPADKNQEALLPINDLFWRTEITLTSSYAGSPDDYREALLLISEGGINLKNLITHRFGLQDTALGFKLVSEARESVKIIIEPQK